ncbi:V-type ATP synthase subunit I [Acidaminobacter hydrogenoformans]|uniref:V/A-type H+-transporting ATPase subunit I n=1 Tax=Acidaminobacter hydrogenoformans DSM 2784 TaxID=1120920 RepID=A0A1G5S549_9FIRM|nr:V-type ATPase 116kDa subunit family protein [Acidaminobacter hydrogenoformans]SCZ80649.1 V/A-type H+-transporting ATPase subunit I [Acidaminobacter hydrogenoformans DSM 2784]
MAIEKMIMVNLVADLALLDEVLKEIALFERIQLVNAYHEIEESNFRLSMVDENRDEILNMCRIEPYKTQVDPKALMEKAEKLLMMLGLDKKLDRSYLEDPEWDWTLELVEKKIDLFTEEVSEDYSVLSALREERVHLKELECLGKLQETEVDLEAILNMENFSARLGVLSKENRYKLSLNYENITAVVMHLDTIERGEAELIISPKELDAETDRILRSVYFEEIPIPEAYRVKAPEAMRRILARQEEIETEITQKLSELEVFKRSYEVEIQASVNALALERVKVKMRRSIATTRNFFYLAGWIPEREKDLFEARVKVLGPGTIVMFNDTSNAIEKHTPPTLLKNRWLVKPFEMLVSMYGTPAYNETDPTVFFGITYMTLFGAMFGDLGQGIVLFLAGMVLTKRTPENLYFHILARLGISSAFFGFFYDSFFGYEHLISKLFPFMPYLRPIENINTILGVSVGVGVFLLLISFAYSILNKLRVGDLKEGWLGRNGVAGLILYLTLIQAVMKIALDTPGLPVPLSVIVVAACVAAIIGREPLANLIKGVRPLYHEKMSEYYVESGFDILETFLSMLSNSISFIRVGAFALNHVGLFVAFHTMGALIGNLGGEILMFFLGNLIVIFLEGLIVMIQGLRLMYYELFSKYYSGDGEAFDPVRFQEV